MFHGVDRSVRRKMSQLKKAVGCLKSLSRGKWDDDIMNLALMMGMIAPGGWLDPLLANLLRVRTRIWYREDRTEFKSSFIAL